MKFKIIVGCCCSSVSYINDQYASNKLKLSSCNISLHQIITYYEKKHNIYTHYINKPSVDVCDSKSSTLERRSASLTSLVMTTELVVGTLAKIYKMQQVFFSQTLVLAYDLNTVLNMKQITHKRTNLAVHWAKHCLV